MKIRTYENYWPFDILRLPQVKDPVIRLYNSKQPPEIISLQLGGKRDKILKIL